MVYIFLKYFIQNISQMMLPNVYIVSVKNKTTLQKYNEQWNNEMKYNKTQWTKIMNTIK